MDSRIEEGAGLRWLVPVDAKAGRSKCARDQSSLFVPLVQRKIGRNPFYGFRTSKTLASDKAWYAVNYGAAKAGVYLSIGMVIFGIVLALLGIVQAHLP
jgi:hypothetical protein